MIFKTFARTVNAHHQTRGPHTYPWGRRRWSLFSDLQVLGSCGSMQTICTELVQDTVVCSEQVRGGQRPTVPLCMVLLAELLMIRDRLEAKSAETRQEKCAEAAFWPTRSGYPPPAIAAVVHALSWRNTKNILGLQH